MNDDLLRWDDESWPTAFVLPEKGDYLRIEFFDGEVHHTIVADSREHDGGGTIRLIGDPTNEAEL